MILSRTKTNETYFDYIDSISLSKITMGETNYGECRCCLTKGNHRDMTKEYYSDGICEIYTDIFIECFNLFLCSDTRLTSLICRSCIKQLKDAYSFKTTVINLESEMLKAFRNGEGNETVFINGLTEIIKEEKKESVKDEMTDDEERLEYIEEELNFDDIDLVSGEEQLLARFPKNIVPLPTRSELNSLCPEYAKRLEELKDKVISAKMVQRLLSQPTVKDRNKRKKAYNRTINKEFTNPSNNSTVINKISEKMAHVNNISTLLANSNLTAFMSKFKNGYPCFFCKNIFEEFKELRLHQQTHSKDDIERFVSKKYRRGRPDSLVVYVDVSELKCNLCGLEIPSLNELKSHLTGIHKKILHSEYSDRVIPFQISDNYLCQVCNFNFETFGAIERHMNTHFRNYVCEECGAGFIAKHRLKIHKYNIHSAQGKFPCDACKKSFVTYRRLKIHNDLVHKLSKKLQCPKCPDRFSYYYVRQKHLLDVHGETPVIYKCNVCEKEFKRRYPLSVHIKKEHLSQGDYNCDLCSYTCFSSNELKVHLMKRHWEKSNGKMGTKK